MTTIGFCGPQYFFKVCLFSKVPEHSSHCEAFGRSFSFYVIYVCFTLPSFLGNFWAFSLSGSPGRLQPNSLETTGMENTTFNVTVLKSFFYNVPDLFNYKKNCLLSPAFHTWKYTTLIILCIFHNCHKSPFPLLLYCDKHKKELGLKVLGILKQKIQNNLLMQHCNYFFLLFYF